MGIEVPPLNYSISRWIQSNPQYDVGHLELVDEIEAGLPAGLHVTGSPYRGVGLPDCVRQSQETAARIVGELVLAAPHRTDEASTPVDSH
jgi:oxygen-dependent protoporphyrinogen oxidase